MGKEKINIEKSWLYNQYINLEKTSIEIAKEKGCCQRTILNYLHKYEIPVRTSPTKILIDENWLYNQYINKEHSSRKIAKLLGCGKKAVLRRLKQYGIPIREDFNGENNPMWKGNNIGYKAIHKWLRRNFTKPDSCEICKKKTEDLDLASISRVHIRDINNYQWLCHKCHMVLDHGREDTKTQYFLKIKKKNQTTLDFYSSSEKGSLTES